jgi:hypothetical protein
MLIEDQSPQLIQGDRGGIHLAEVDFDASHSSARELLGLVSANWMAHSYFDQQGLIVGPGDYVGSKVREVALKKHRVKDEPFGLANPLRFH